jgi:KaiC/GvpD/RAD55 family RecA-like ATPase
MNPVTPATKYLDGKGIPYDWSEDQRTVSVDCPACKAKRSCSVVVATWMWTCSVNACEGNQYRMQVLHGAVYSVAGANPGELPASEAVREMRARTPVDKYADQFWNRPEAEHARQYMIVERRISEEVLRAAKVGFARRFPKKKTDQPVAAKVDRTAALNAAQVTDLATTVDTGWVTMPIYGLIAGRVNDEELNMVKFRSIPPSRKMFLRAEGGQTSLYAPCRINPFDETEPLIITGAEIDCLSVLTAGWSNVCSVTAGEGSWNASYDIDLEPFERIIIMFDNDDAGRAGAQYVANKLGRHRCSIAEWPAPYKDANAALQGMGEKFDVFLVAKLVASAKPCAGEDITTVAKMEDELLAFLAGSAQGRTWGLGSDFDRLTGGRMAGEFTLLIGDTGSGKSTLASQVALAVARSGDATLVLPLEIGPKKQAVKFMRQQGGKSPKRMDVDERRKYIRQVGALPLYIMQHMGSLNAERLRATIEYAVRRLGVKLIVLDHIHHAVKTGDKEREELDGMARTIKEVLEETEVTMLAVAHPHATGKSDEKNRDNRVIQLGDIKGTSSLKQLADNVLSVWRKRTDKRENVLDQNGLGTTIVYALKLRDDDAVEGSTMLKFKVDSATYVAPIHEGSQPSLDTPSQARTWHDDIDD